MGHLTVDFSLPTAIKNPERERSGPLTNTDFVDHCSNVGCEAAAALVGITMVR